MEKCDFSQLRKRSAEQLQSKLMMTSLGAIENDENLDRPTVVQVLGITAAMLATQWGFSDTDFVEAMAEYVRNVRGAFGLPVANGYVLGEVPDPDQEVKSQTDKQMVDERQMGLFDSDK